MSGQAMKTETLAAQEHGQSFPNMFFFHSGEHTWCVRTFLAVHGGTHTPRHQHLQVTQKLKQHRL